MLMALLAAGCRHAPEHEPELALQVHCVTPTRQAIDETIELRGRLEPPPGGDLPLASQVSGRILEVLVHEGDRVRLGEVVASVDDLPSRDAMRQAEAALAQANAAELNANATLERTRALVGRGIAARQELDDASAKAETEKQAVAATRAALDLARRTLGRVQVRSAFSGLVTRVFRGPGAIVDGTAATPIAQVAAAGAEFVADATEPALLRLQIGNSARVQLGTAPALNGTVRAVPSALDPATGIGSVRISLLDAPQSLLLGAHGHARIVTKHRESVLVVPAQALRGAAADGAELVVCAGNTAQVRRVELGYRDEQQLEIRAGLAVDEKVAIDHVLGLESGTALVAAP